MKITTTGPVSSPILPSTSSTAQSEPALPQRFSEDDVVQLSFESQEADLETSGQAGKTNPHTPYP
jgi:hypothetical protein